MRTQFTGDSTAQTALKMADTYMAAGRWETAETLIREYCTEQADLNLRLAQLEWRRQCVEYASGLDWDVLGGSCGLILAARRQRPVKAPRTGFSFYPTTLSSKA